MENSYYLRSTARSTQPESNSQRPEPPPLSAQPTAQASAVHNPTMSEGEKDAEGVFTLADVMRSIQDSEARVCAKLDGLQRDFDKVKEKMGELEVAVEFNASKVDVIEKEKLPQIESNLRKEIDQLRTKLIESEIYQRKNNLLFYGVQMEQGENVYAVLRHTFTLLGLSKAEAEAICLINVHRLPQRHSQEGSPHPIIAKFVYMSQRNRVLAAFEERSFKKGAERIAVGAAEGATAKAPTGAAPGDKATGNAKQTARKVTVRTDLPPALKVARSELAKVAYRMRREKNLSTKIAVVGVKVVLFFREKGTKKWETYKE